ncbi:hypothetical protein [Pilimelia columellifera]|uniref:DUF11 domain-containing protein n=1 Tax=Pilimelia columellifera subsp. columellifera TaxID=706583 RepID=A0ABP6A641_9ACTN
MSSGGSWRRAHAVVVLLFAAIPVSPTPAAAAVRGAATAAVTDLAVTVTGLTLARGARHKVADVTVLHRGRWAATGVTVTIDLSRLDRRRARVDVPDRAACQLRGTAISCRVADIPAGSALDLAVPVRAVGPTNGAAGAIRVAVSHDGPDRWRPNNAVTADVTVADRGPDLYVYAPDLPFDAGARVVGAARPGRPTPLRFVVGNAGNQRASGFVVRIALPHGVRFAKRRPACRYPAGGRHLECRYPSATLAAPGHGRARLRFVENVVVGAGVEGRVVRGARVSAHPLGAAPAGERPDLDPSDNRDELVIHLGDGQTRALAGAPRARAAGGADRDRTGGPGGGSAGVDVGTAVGWLPRTGDAAARLLAAGLLTAVAGVGLVAGSRRRSRPPAPVRVARRRN